jgi:hypothetical protein
MDEFTEKLGKVTRQEIMDRIIEERDNKRETWIKEGGEGITTIAPDDGITIKVTSKEKYVFYVRVYENGKIEVITEGEETPPTLQNRRYNI